MIVFLLRHGEAEDIGPGEARTDDARRLTEAGRERLVRAGRAWRRCVGQPDAIHTSPLVRARQTAEVLAQAVRFEPEPTVSDWLVPEADPEAAARCAIAETLAGRDSLVFVGHEPHLGELLARLLLGGGAIPLKKGMLVGVELDSPVAASGRLVCCLSAKLAATVGDD